MQAFNRFGLGILIVIGCVVGNVWRFIYVGLIVCLWMTKEMKRKEKPTEGSPMRSNVKHTEKRTQLNDDADDDDDGKKCE